MIDEERLKMIPLESLKEQVLEIFECQHTGHCCKREGYVIASQQELEAMAAHTKTSVSEFEFHYVIRDNGWKAIATPHFRSNCFLNEKNECSIYEVRPKACKTYPNWPEIWQSWDCVKEEAQSCKGLQKALKELSASTESN